MPRSYKKRYVPKPGDKFDRLTIKELFIGKGNKTWAYCLCKCGEYTYQIVARMVSGVIVSCGCHKAEQARLRTIKRNYKHGKGHKETNRLYRIWSAMRNRCNNVNNPSYPDYGGRGITVYHLWNNNYIEFEIWSINNGYTENLTIDRINVNGNYEPSNCRWSTYKEQARNRRNNRMDTVKITAFGETKSVIDWIEDNRCKIKTVAALLYRIGSGLSTEEAITKPSQRSK